MIKIIVVGGGASGIVAAITAARLGAKVTILERLDRIGKKILATGNGRCNLSNTHACPTYYHTAQSKELIKEVLLKFPISNTLVFFEEMGIELIEKEEGKLYPRSEQAGAVLNVLLHELERLKIEVFCNQEVQNIELGKNIKVQTATQTFYGNRLILAAGGKASPDLGSNGSGYDLARKLGHQLTEIYPSLVQLKTSYPYLKQVHGTKVNGTVCVLDDQKKLLRKEKGEILFTDYGISGPPVLQVSRHAAKRSMVSQSTYILLDIVDEYSEEELKRKLIKRFNQMPTKSAQESFVGFVNNRLIIPLLKECGVDLNKKVSEITAKESGLIARYMKNIEMKVLGTHQWNQAQVTAGGVRLNEINPLKLNSVFHANVFFCGEILDVDGDCGGYNLQWAFSSGAIAGQSAADEEGFDENSNRTN